MPDGDRVLKETEWALFAFGLDLLRDQIEMDIILEADLAIYGLPAFDNLSAEQKLVLAANVAEGLRRPSVPAPVLTAANESAIKAVFIEIGAYIDVEIDEEAMGTSDSFELRRLLLAAVKDSPDLTRLPKVTSRKRESWRFLLEGIEEHFFWDADFEMDGLILDLPPENSRQIMKDLQIHDEYFLSTPNEPKPKELKAARDVLKDLSGQ